MVIIVVCLSTPDASDSSSCEHVNLLKMLESSSNVAAPEMDLPPLFRRASNAAPLPTLRHGPRR
jgi:hypothetical protein